VRLCRRSTDLPENAWGGLACGPFSGSISRRAIRRWRATAASPRHPRLHLAAALALNGSDAEASSSACRTKDRTGEFPFRDRRQALSSRKLVEQRLRLFPIAGVKPFSEPAVGARKCSATISINT
jgi:hypothetical protein